MNALCFIEVARRDDSHQQFVKTICFFILNFHKKFLRSSFRVAFFESVWMLPWAASHEIFNIFQCCPAHLRFVQSNFFVIIIFPAVSFAIVHHLSNE